MGSRPSANESGSSLSLGLVKAVAWVAIEATLSALAGHKVDLIEDGFVSKRNGVDRQVVVGKVEVVPTHTEPTRHLNCRTRSR